MIWPKNRSLSVFARAATEASAAAAAAEVAKATRPELSAIVQWRNHALSEIFDHKSLFAQLIPIGLYQLVPRGFGLARSVQYFCLFPPLSSPY